MRETNRNIVWEKQMKLEEFISQLKAGALPKTPNMAYGIGIDLEEALEGSPDLLQKEVTVRFYRWGERDGWNLAHCFLWEVEGVFLPPKHRQGFLSKLKNTEKGFLISSGWEQTSPPPGFPWFA